MLRIPSCTHGNCTARGAFGLQGSTRLYCRLHLPAELRGIAVDQGRRRCKREGCPTRPCFGVKEDTVSAVVVSYVYIIVPICAALYHTAAAAAAATARQHLLTFTTNVALLGRRCPHTATNTSSLV
jgi:hypothetical protein